MGMWIRTLKLKILVLCISHLIFTAACIFFLPAKTFAQEDLSDFTATFQVFLSSRDAYKTFDISPEDVIYPLPQAYRLGPGDILQIILTGMINDSLPLQIGPQGNIYVPPAGLLNVNGMTVDEARNYIKSELDKFLINYDLAVQLMRGRRIKVYLLGQVRQPGTYLSVAGTTALSLIQSAGTLVVNPVQVNIDETKFSHPYFRALTSGAGRRVEVWRSDKKVAELDLAKIAILGVAKDDIILEDGDALFVPANSCPVVVRGGVARPGTYEIHKDDSVFDVLAQAGGYRSMMMLDSVQVERPGLSGNPSDSKVITLNLKDPKFDPSSFSFQPGDILKVPEVKDQVYVLGAVWMPQAVDYREGWNALDYIAATGGPVSPSDVSSITIVSFPLTDAQTMFNFNFKNLSLGKPVENVKIQAGDLIFVPWENEPYYGVGLTNAFSNLLAQTLGLLRIIKDIS